MRLDEALALGLLLYVFLVFLFSRNPLEELRDSLRSVLEGLTDTSDWQEAQQRLIEEAQRRQLEEERLREKQFRIWFYQQMLREREGEG